MYAWMSDVLPSSQSSSFMGDLCKCSSSHAMIGLLFDLNTYRYEGWEYTQRRYSLPIPTKFRASYMTDAAPISTINLRISRPLLQRRKQSKTTVCVISDQSNVGSWHCLGHLGRVVSEGPCHSRVENS